jgi:transposase-like protein
MSKRRPRRRYEAPFKARVALAAVRGDKTLGQVASQFDVHGNLVSQWKRKLLANVSRVFEEPDDPAGHAQQALIDELHRKIGQLNVELDWLKKKAAQFGG